MSSNGRDWSREETMLAFELYCTLPPNEVNRASNKQIQELAKAIGRTANSVKLKLQNFKSCDPSYTCDGKVGLANASKLDKVVCDEFLNNWDSLLFEVHNIKERMKIAYDDFGESTEGLKVLSGKDGIRLQKVRIGQAFFRKAVLSEYDNKCCITGINIPKLLRASHIKPWKDCNDINEKSNPRNGLLLNALHDVAFDSGFITLDLNYRVVVSSQLQSADVSNCEFITKYCGCKISAPTRFFPAKEFIEYHNNMIFRR